MTTVSAFRKENELKYLPKNTLLFKKAFKLKCYVQSMYTEHRIRPLMVQDSYRTRLKVSSVCGISLCVSKPFAHTTILHVCLYSLLLHIMFIWLPSVIVLFPYVFETPGISITYFVHLFFGSKGLKGMRGR